MNSVRKFTNLKLYSFSSLYSSILGSKIITTRVPVYAISHQPSLYYKPVYRFSNENNGDKK